MLEKFMWAILWVWAGIATILSLVMFILTWVVIAGLAYLVWAVMGQPTG